MKKLMTMIAAVATAFGLYADATLNDAFEAKNLGAGPFTPTAPGWAEYTGADGTLNITGEEGERVLDIATGSAALTRYAAENGAEFAIDAENNLFLDMTVDFKAQALDEVPTNNITATDKIGLFVLDTSDIEGAPAMTNLFAIAGYGAAGKALYDLGPVDDEWFGFQKRITIKAYDNVFQSGTRTGFLVSVVDAKEDVSPMSVSAVYPIVGGAVTWKDASTPTDYLGGVALISKVAKWAKPADKTARNLLFSMTQAQADNGSLTSIDFMGNAQIANVGFTETNPGFADDAVTMTVVRDSDVSFDVTSPATGVTYDGTTTLTSEGYEGPVTITVTAAKPIVEVDVNGTPATQNGNDWTFTFTKDTTLNVKDYAAAAYVGTTPFKSLFDDEEAGYVGAISHVNQNGGTLKLAQNVTALEETEAFAFSGEKDIILDLAGKTLTVYDGAKLSNVGKLTIMDSLTGGNIVGDVDNYNALVISNGVFNGELLNSWDDGLNGVTTIYDGTFEGAVVNDPFCADDETAVKIIAVGGKFRQKDDQDADVNTKEAVEEFVTDATLKVVDDKAGYWQIVARGPSVANINGEGYYETLQEAADAAKTTGDTIALIADVAESAITFSNEVNVTLNLAGHSITNALNNNTYVINVYNGTGTLTVTDTFGNGVIHKFGGTGIGSLITVGCKKEDKQGNLVWAGGKAQCEGSNVIKVDDGDFEITGGEIVQGTAENRALRATFEDGGTAEATLTGGTIRGNINIEKGTSGGSATIVLEATSTTIFDTIAKTNIVAYELVPEGKQLVETQEGSGLWRLADKPTTFNITFAEVQNGTLETSVTNGVNAGDTVTVYATPAPDFECTEITTNGAALAKGETSFTMPAEGVEVGATFTLKPQPVDPDVPQHSDNPEADAQKFNEMTSEQKAEVIANPGIDKSLMAGYAGKFQAVPDNIAKTVTIKLTVEAKQDLEDQEKEETAKIPVSAIAAATGTTDQEITVTPGFFYSVIANSSLDGMKVRSCKVATGTALTVTLPHYENSGFYTIKASVKAQEVEADFVEDK